MVNKHAGMKPAPSRTAVLLPLLAWSVGCGDANLDPIGYAGNGLLDNPQPNALALRAGDLPSVSSDTASFHGMGLDGDTLVVLSSNRPLSCVAPRDAVGCPDGAGWLYAVALPSEADFSEPIGIHDAPQWMQYFGVVGSSGCSEGGFSARRNAAGATLSLTSGEGSISAELAGTEEVIIRDTDGDGTVSETRFTVDGTYRIVRCDGVSQLANQ